MDLMLLSSEEPVGSMKVKGSLGRTGREMVMFRILGSGRRAKSKVPTWISGG